MYRGKHFPVRKDKCSWNKHSAYVVKSAEEFFFFFFFFF